MRRRFVTVLLAAGAAAGCGGEDAPAVRAPAAVAQEVRAVFADYTRAMGAGDYERACGLLAPETTRTLVEKGGEDAGARPRTCADVLRRQVVSATAQDRRELQEVSRTARVEGVYVVEGRDDAVTVAWSARAGGRRVPVQQPARRVGGRWRLVGAGR